MIPMRGAYLICTAMFSNGATIGMADILLRPKRILLVRLRGRKGCCVGEVGAATAGIAGRPTVSVTLPILNPTVATGGFVWSSRVDN